jgi:hypothetical protein
MSSISTQQQQPWRTCPTLTAPPPPPCPATTCREVKEAEAQRQGVELSDVQPAWDQHAAESVSLIIHHEAIKRCKRVVMTYMYVRLLEGSY